MKQQMTALAFLMLLVAAQLLGCERREAHSADRLSQIGLAQAWLHEADVLENMGQRAEAAGRARRVLNVELEVNDPLRQPLRLDAYARIAELLLADGDVDGAEQAIASALAEVDGHSYFEARLYMVRGQLHEARAEAERARGNEAQAQAELRAALADHEQSVTINEGLLERAE